MPARSKSSGLRLRCRPRVPPLPSLGAPRSGGGGLYRQLPAPPLLRARGGVAAGEPLSAASGGNRGWSPRGSGAAPAARGAAASAPGPLPPPGGKAGAAASAPPAPFPAEGLRGQGGGRGRRGGPGRAGPGAALLAAGLRRSLPLCAACGCGRCSCLGLWWHQQFLGLRRGGGVFTPAGSEATTENASSTVCVSGRSGSGAGSTAFPGGRG